ncbi:MAG: Maf family nucleotide pyrophosphatase [Bacteroidales bacterium]|jgi:septum formation protein
MVFGIPASCHIILASRSPRRQQLLKEAGFLFTVRLMDYDESIPESLKGKEIAEYLSAQKARSFMNNNILSDEIVITADTIVWCNGKVLDKPRNYEDAVDILSEISANTHDVITGVTLLSSGRLYTFSEITKVTFDVLSQEDIDHYIRNFSPFDKAGAYGIQEWIGLIGNSRIEGSYFNVMGLPVQRLIKELRIFLRQ